MQAFMVFPCIAFLGDDPIYSGLPVNPGRFCDLILNMTYQLLASAYKPNLGSASLVSAYPSF